MDESPRELLALEHYYKNAQKLDYFILGIDLALLGWTIVNTEWVPKEPLHILLIIAFWVTIIFSIVTGVIKQLYITKAFGSNYQYRIVGRLADEVESALFQRGLFIDPKTRRKISLTDIKQSSIEQRKSEKKWRKTHEKLVRKARVFGGMALGFLILALLLLLTVKILSFQLYT